MKRIGLLGGMSWESSAEYYRLVNEAVRDRLGGLHSADCVLRSVDFAEIEALQRDGRWDAAGARLAGEARALERAGAELLVLCTNTMHRVAGEIADAVGVPFVHIADATADAVRAARPAHRRAARDGVHDGAGLLRRAAARRARARRARPAARRPRAIVHDVIYEELCVGVVDDGSRDAVPADHGRPRRPRRGGRSCSAARRSTCSSGRATRRCRSSTRPGCTPSAPSSWRSRRSAGLRRRASIHSAGATTSAVAPIASAATPKPGQRQAAEQRQRGAGRARQQVVEAEELAALPRLGRSRRARRWRRRTRGSSRCRARTARSRWRARSPPTAG